MIVGADKVKPERIKKMLNIIDREHFAKVIEFSKKVGLEKNLQENLDFLASYACNNGEEFDETKTRCDLYKDIGTEPSFYFIMYKRTGKGESQEYKKWFNGGCIFHGPHDGFGSGSAPTFSVCLNHTLG
jgi:hypothetical protein